LLERLTARQLAEWEEYSKLDPIGEWKHDFELAYLLSVITNLFIGVHAKKGAKMTKPEEFLIKWDNSMQEEKQQSIAEMRNVLMALATTQNKKVGEKTIKRK
jgi:hypothetical protein